MPGKQLEMDEVVREIYLAMETYDHLKSSLLVLSGDHGMNEAGNHGGSSLGEASTALVFVSPMFRSVFNGLQCPTTGSEGLRFYETVEQSDIAPTLAALLGFPVPRNNLGIVIPAFLDLWKQGINSCWATKFVFVNIDLQQIPRNSNFSSQTLYRCLSSPR